MSYTRPGPVIRRTFENVATNPQPAELTSAIVGPLYQVVENGSPDETFDALDAAAQGFAWPNQKLGSVVDLAGTRGGYIDSQRKEFFDFVPTFSLRDPVTQTVYPVADSFVQGIDQDGFELTQGARGSNQRATLSFWAIQMDDARRFYRPPQVGTVGFSQVRAGDRFLVDSTEFTVASYTDTLLNATAEPMPSASAFIETDGSQQVDVTLGASAGRVVVTVGTSDFPTLAAGASAGDPVVVWAPRAGFAGIAAALTPSFEVADGLVIGVAFQPSDVIGRLAKVVNSTDSTVTWTRVVNYDPNSLNIIFADNVGTTNNDVLSITLYDRVLGYIESFNATNDQITCVVSRSFAAVGSAVEIYHTPTDPVPFWPAFEVLATYRALRADLANSVYSASTLSELLDVIGETSVRHEDRLAFAVRQAQLRQVGDRSVFFTVVNVEPDGTTGLPENADLATGYAEALTRIGTEDVFSLVCFDLDNASVLSAYNAHILSMNTPQEGRERRGYQLVKMPLGETESITGVVQPGRTLTGTAATEADGNGVIYDANVQFVSGAGVVEGTRVVVTRPAELAGTYQASANTSDGALILEGLTWSIVKYGDRSAAGLSLSTSGGLHTLSGATAGHWRDVEPGDVINVTADGTTYRGVVTSVPGNASSLVFEDEAPGDLTLTGAALSGNVWVSRSWGGAGNSPFVEYHIRPLTRAQQASRLIAGKTQSSEHMSYLIRQRPTMQVDTNESGQAVVAPLDATFAIAAVSGLRSGYAANQDITRLTLGDNIFSIEYGVNWFTQTQMDALAAAGFTLLVQDNQRQTPYIRDMVTSRVGSLAVSQEVVIANSAWQAKTLRSFFSSPAGQPLPNNTEQLRGIRLLQLNAVLKSWVDSGRLVDFDTVTVSVDANDETKNFLSYRGFFPVAEKVIEIEIKITT